MFCARYEIFYIGNVTFFHNCFQFKLKEEAVKAINPQLMTIATLTGHAYLTVGEPYSIILDNGPAARQQVSQKVQEAGSLLGDMFEISTIRKEDYAFVKGKL